MTRIERSALVAYSAAQLYEVVNDVASYPQFLAGCESSEVHEASESHMLATLKKRQPISMVPGATIPKRSTGLVLCPTRRKA